MQRVLVLVQRCWCRGAGAEVLVQRCWCRGGVSFMRRRRGGSSLG